ncbi:MAG: hypothetical protein GY839_02640 [candidate division Zixibacteria bacterium]|nr:hypothetical protein [candidate division Zixibacteria bacterium]
MKIIDLTDYYTEYLANNGDLGTYEKSYPALFNHYFKYWADRIKPVAKISKAEISNRVKLITDSLNYLELKFNMAGFDIANLKIVLFVGVNKTNGHAFKDGDEYIVWLPIETYFSRQLCDVFISHEIGHALHYMSSEDFYFNDLSEKLTVSRQLVTEGLATFLSMKILNIGEGEALWADYLSREDKERWLSQCLLERKTLNKFVLDNFNKNDSRIGLFYANDPDNIYYFRAGYYVGLKLIEEVSAATKIGLSELLEMPRLTLDKLIFELLIN